MTTTGEVAAPHVGAEIETLKPGTLVVGVDVPYPPFEQGRPPDYEGFEIDLMNEIASRLGLETEYKDTPFDTIFRDLAQDKFDAAIAGSTITDRAREGRRLRRPVGLTEQSLLVQEGSDIKTLDDVEGKTVGVQKGTTGADYAKDERRTPATCAATPRSTTRSTRSSRARWTP